MMIRPSVPEERAISLKHDLPVIPERLLLAHARGQVLFIAGAGVSIPSGLPSFRDLTIEVYEKLDITFHSVITSSEDPAKWDLSSLDDSQIAEINRFKKNEFDVALGMLERRIGVGPGSKSVKDLVIEILRGRAAKPAKIHSALMRLADRGGSSAIVTTNFDLLLQKAGKKLTKPLTYALGSIPRPSKKYDFSGIFHIHGALNEEVDRVNEIIITDEDFGEFYMRRRTVPDFIYDATRLYHLVFVGYSADDPPMKYLLNAIAADGRRFDDHKERFSFVGVDETDQFIIEDWKKRGITPISYHRKDHHLELLKLLERWGDLSAHNGKPKFVETEIKRIVKKKRSDANESDKDLFDHLIRRGNSAERFRLSKLVSSTGASIDWANAILTIISEHPSEA